MPHICGTLRIPSAVLTVEKVAHSRLSGLVRLTFVLAFDGIPGALGYWIDCVGSAAFGALICKTRLVWLQLEFFGTDHTSLDREGHSPLQTRKPNRLRFSLTTLA